MFINYIKLYDSCLIVYFVLCEASFLMTHMVGTSPANDTFGAGFDFTFSTETLD